MTLTGLARLVAAAMAGLVLGVVTTPDCPPPPPPAPAPVCRQLPAEEVCPGWLFGSNLKAAKKRICQKPR